MQGSQRISTKSLWLFGTRTLRRNRFSFHWSSTKNMLWNDWILSQCHGVLVNGLYGVPLLKKAKVHTKNLTCFSHVFCFCFVFSCFAAPSHFVHHFTLPIKAWCLATMFPYINIEISNHRTRIIVLSVRTAYYKNSVNNWFEFWLHNLLP